MGLDDDRRPTREWTPRRIGFNAPPTGAVIRRDSRAAHLRRCLASRSRRSSRRRATSHGKRGVSEASSTRENRCGRTHRGVVPDARAGTGVPRNVAPGTAAQQTAVAVAPQAVVLRPLPQTPDQVITGHPIIPTHAVRGRDDDQRPGRFVSVEGQADVRGGQADDSRNVSNGRPVDGCRRCGRADAPTATWTGRRPPAHSAHRLSSHRGFNQGVGEFSDPPHQRQVLRALSPRRVVH